MIDKIVMTGLVIAASIATAQGHMGKYPCDPNTELIAKIRGISTNLVPEEFYLKAALDLVVDAAEHCREEGLVEAMKGFMEGTKAKEDAVESIPWRGEGLLNPKGFYIQHNFRVPDGCTQWLFSDERPSKCQCPEGATPPANTGFYPCK